MQKGAKNVRYPQWEQSHDPIPEALQEELGQDGVVLSSVFVVLQSVEAMLGDELGKPSHGDLLGIVRKA